MEGLCVTLQESRAGVRGAPGLRPGRATGDFQIARHEVSPRGAEVKRRRLNGERGPEQRRDDVGNGAKVHGRADGPRGSQPDGDMA